MRSAKFRKSERCLWAMLLALVCVSMFPFPSDAGDSLEAWDTQLPDMGQDSAFCRNVGKDAWLPTFIQNPLIDFLCQHNNSNQLVRQFSGRKNNSHPRALFELPDGVSFPLAPRLLSLSNLVPVCKTKYFLITPYDPQAPPFAH